MNNNDIFKKLRVALMLRDDQIVDILQLVDFRISKAELSAFFRNADHPNYMECGDQVLRNFLNGLVIHLRGTKENPKNPNEVLEANKLSAKTPAKGISPRQDAKKPVAKQPAKNFNAKRNAPKKPEIVEKVAYKNGKSKKS
ncbi:DUF1456 domain-containing protein [Flavobacterium magnum]|uniref:DUF1456 domain-containing protein n=1 Tax=Flavobacterium magnum TaxID=2162713 RepID=A0A2S0RG67_9FLAO|nr:DUF1456 family protein [Flavobacterium magnum]AWA30228.1 DUF1456 domain-containing protein [Flavobacterium magnum]